MQYPTNARRRRLLAVSDLHVDFPENRTVLEALRPESDDDWLIVADRSRADLLTA
jgi:hypothetical protein